VRAELAIRDGVFDPDTIEGRYRIELEQTGDKEQAKRHMLDSMMDETAAILTQKGPNDGPLE